MVERTRKHETRKRKNQYQLTDSEFTSNPQTRTPVCLVLDTSGSMIGTPITELQLGVEKFLEEVKEDIIASASAEIAIVTFSTEAEIALPFTNVEDIALPKFKAEGWTMMGTGVNLALDILEERKEIYSSAGIDYHQPWMVLMTDGHPENEPEEVTKAAAQRTKELIMKRKLVIFPLGIGDLADFNALEMFSPNFTPLKLKGLKFSSFFKWLSQSVVRTSQSLPGQEVQLDKDGIHEWAEIKGWDSFGTD